MSAENRDWYRDWWRKKTGYVERALFRLSQGEVDRRKRVAWSNWHWSLKLLAVFAVWLVLKLVIRGLRAAGIL